MPELAKPVNSFPPHTIPPPMPVPKVTITADAIKCEREAEILREEGRPARPRLGAAELRAERGGQQAHPRGNAS